MSYTIHVDCKKSRLETYKGVVVSFDLSRESYEEINKYSDELGLHRDENGSVEIPLELYLNLVDHYDDFKLGLDKDKIEIARFNSGDQSMDIRMAIKSCQVFNEAVLVDSSLEEFAKSAGLDLNSLTPEYSSIFKYIDKYGVGSTVIKKVA